MTESPRSEQVRIGDLDLRLLVCGTGPVLLCLHGIGGSAHTFDAQLEALSDLYTVVAWDAPGYAHSADPEAALDLDAYVDLALEVADQFGEGRSILLGMSWGAVIAAAAAARSPDRPKALVLGDGTRGSGTGPERTQKMLDRIAELQSVGPDAFARRRAPRLVAPGTEQSIIEKVAAAMASSIRLPGYTSAATMMADTDITQTLTTVSVPTLVIYGEQDKVTGHTESELIAEAINGSIVTVVPGAGHLSNQERPTSFNQKVREFLSTVG